MPNPTKAPETKAKPRGVSLYPSDVALLDRCAHFLDTNRSGACRMAIAFAVRMGFLTDAEKHHKQRIDRSRD